MEIAHQRKAVERQVAPPSVAVVVAERLREQAKRRAVGGGRVAPPVEFSQRMLCLCESGTVGVRASFDGLFVAGDLCAAAGDAFAQPGTMLLPFGSFVGVHGRLG